MIYKVKVRYQMNCRSDSVGKHKLTAVVGKWMENQLVNISKYPVPYACSQIKLADSNNYSALTSAFATYSTQLN